MSERALAAYIAVCDVPNALERNISIIGQSNLLVALRDTHSFRHSVEGASMQ